MSLKEKLKNAIINYLNIEVPQGVSIDIKQLLDFEADTFKNKIWYRGRAEELEQLYKSINDGIGNSHFWGSVPSKDMKIRKVHTGLPSLIVDVLTDVCTEDLTGVDVSERQELWNAIAEENDFHNLVEKAVKDVFVTGDGAFKLSFDSKISQYPIIEFFSADRVDYDYTRGRITGICFKTKKSIGNSSYILKELYTKEGISYTLETSDGKQKALSDFEETAHLQNIKNNAHFLAAVPLRFRQSSIYPGRGKSLFDGKLDNFDSFDEVVAQWMLAVRKGQIKTYIPDVFLPRNVKTGEIMQYNDFDNDYISIESDMQQGDNKKITTTQGTIQHEALLSTYCTVLDLCLQGIISPSTLGIDVKKLDNAEAQREKEKTTLYTRNKCVSTLAQCLKQLVKTTLMFYDNLQNKTYKDVDIDINFGGYANPSFEANIETVGKAASSGIMSVETQVEELYGNDKDAEWKKAEVKRIKAEKGILEADEPAVNIPLNN